MNHEVPPPKGATKGLHVRVSVADYAKLKRDAERYGYDLSSLLRLRIFGKVKGLRLTRQPRADIVLLGEIIGTLTAMTSDLNKLGSNMSLIATRLNEGSRDLFGLDGALRLFERVGINLLRILNLIEAAISGRRKNSPVEDREDAI